MFELNAADILNKLESSDLGLMLITKDYKHAAIDYLGNKARTLNYYKEEGLLPDREKKSNFSFVELSWVRIIYDLRQMGINNILIKKLKETLFSSIDKGILQKALKEKIKEISSHFDYIPDEDFKVIMAEVEKAMLKESYNSQMLTSILTGLLSYSIIKKTPVEIRLYSDGDIMFYNNSDALKLGESESVNLPIHKSYISISLTEIIAYYLQKDYLYNPLHTSLFSKEEIFIIETIRKEKPKSITIDFGDNNKIDLIKSKSIKKVDINQRVAELFLSNGYEAIEVVTQAGKIVGCMKTKKIKPNYKDTE